jgi:hypothetical protein
MRDTAPSWRLVVRAAGLVALGVAAWSLVRLGIRSDGGGAGPAPPAPAGIADSGAFAPAGTRVRVQVLNAGGVAGLARRATIRLREYGYDVVDYGTSQDTSSLTRVRVTRTSRAFGEPITRALGTGRLEEVETLRYVDVVVLLGRDWTPPAEPLRP